MTEKLWGGRFDVDLAELMVEFSESVSYDQRLAAADCDGSAAHARMLGACGIIGADEAARLVSALAEVKSEALAGEIEYRKDLEDIHMNIEVRLRDKVGALAGKLHTGRSRNDQIALDMRLFFRDRSDQAAELLASLALAVAGRAEEYIDALMPGFTHTRKAQPILFSHHLMAYAFMFLRDRERFLDCRRRMNLCPLGAGAFAGTTFPIDREMVARELGFGGVTENSIDTVSDRDYLLEFGSAAAITMTHLSRMMEEFVWWGLDEIGFISLHESYCTGSSMMPNKKNPDAAEITRGKTGRVVGSLMSLFMVMKGTPLSYNRDFQEDKEGMFDLADTLASALMVAERLVATMAADPEKMRRACETGFVLATDVADYLASKGMPFREAHEVSGKLVRYCESAGKGLENLSIEELRERSELFDSDVSEWISLERAVGRRSSKGGTARANVIAQIEQARKIARAPR